jgi:hypothetical protein
VNPDPKTILGRLLSTPESAAEVSVEQVPVMLAHLATLQITLLARLLTMPPSYAQAQKVTEKDRLLTAEEAGVIAGVSPRWLYRHAPNLPFARRLSRKVLRFSETGLKSWLVSKRP